MTAKIIRYGIVKKITATSAEVWIAAESACAGCHSKSVCAASSIQEKVIQADLPADPIRVGDQVEVLMKESLGHLAVFLAYVLPMVFFVAPLFILHHMGFSDGIAALSSLAFTAAYFLVLWLFRNKLRKKFSFSIRKTERPADSACRPL